MFRFLSLRGAVILFVCCLVCKAVVGAPQPTHCHTLFFDDFSSHIYDPYSWTPSGDGALPWIKEHSGFPRALLWPPHHSTLTRIELTLTLDLSAHESIMLSFLAMRRGDKDSPDAPFEDGYDGYGIAVSVDEHWWYPIYNFDHVASEFMQVDIDLDAAIAEWEEIAYTETFHIRFFNFAYDDWSVDSGILLDNIHVTGFPAYAYNFGHAPDPPYSTLLAHDGARHHVGVSNVQLGATSGVDYDGAYCPTMAPTYRDGIVLPDTLVAGEDAAVTVTVPEACFLDGWFDFNGNGTWSPGEHVFDSIALPAGETTLSVAVPADAAPSDRTFARFRVSSAGGLEPTGAAADGEVEDYPLNTECAPPSVEPLPEYTAGGEVSITWTPPFAGAEFEAQHALTEEFTPTHPSSGWIATPQHIFEGLEDETTHYFRVRAGALMPPPQRVWQQSRAKAFMTGDSHDVMICDSKGVRLNRAAPWREFLLNPDFEDMFSAMPFSDSGKINLFLMEEDIVLTEFAMYLRFEEPTEVTFIVYEGGAEENDPVTLIKSVTRDIQPGEGFYSSGDIVLPMSAGTHYYVGVACPDDYTVFTEPLFSPPFPEDMSCASFVSRGSFEGYPPPLTDVSNLGSNALYFTRFTYRPDDNHEDSGTLVSPPILLEPDEAWHTLDYSVEIPDDTMVTVDILPLHDDTPLAGYGDVPPGMDISELPENAIRLRATLATADPSRSPTLRHWSVARRTGEAYRLRGPWSPTVQTTQLNSAPVVETIHLLDDSPTQADTVQYEVVFSQPVTLAPDAMNEAVVLVPPVPESDAALLSITGDTTTYVVTASTGDHSGPLGLHILATDHIVNALDASLAADYTIGPAYQLDFDAPYVETITLLDTAVPDTFPAGFRVVFSEPVHNVSTADFLLSGSADASIDSISGADGIYEVFIVPGENEGDVRLDVVEGGTLHDAVGWPLAATFDEGPAYLIDFAPPCVTDIVLLDPVAPETPTARFEVTFSEPVYDVMAEPPYADFLLVGMSDAAIVAVSGDDGDTVYVVTIEAGDVDGDARLDVITDGALRDWAGRALCADYTDGPAYVFDFNPPRVHAIELLDAQTTNAPEVRYRVVFNKPIFDMDMTPPFADYALYGDADAAIAAVSGTGNEYTVTVAVALEEGTVRLDVVDTGPLVDHLGRGLAVPYDEGPAYNIAPITFVSLPPLHHVVTVGDSLELAVTTSGGTPPVEYQWHKRYDGTDFEPVPGATERVLSFQHVDMDDTGFYYCEAYNDYEQVDSPEFMVVVEEVPLAVGGKLLLVLLWMALATAGYKRGKKALCNMRTINKT